MRPKSAIFTLAVCAAAACVSAQSPASADVVGLEIGTIGYNAYGADTADNRNSEFVDVKNTSGAALPVTGLLVQDAWARGRDKTSGCNTYKVPANGVPTATAGVLSSDLPSGSTLRVHMGSGTPVVKDGVHHVYRNMWTKCGYNGHIFNNGAGSNRWADWDRVWVTLGGASESKGYNFSFGYVAR